MELNASSAPGALLDPPPADPEPTEVVGPAPDAVVVVNGAGTLVSATYGSGAPVNPVEAGAPSAESRSSIPIPRIAATARGEVARGAVRRAWVGRGPTALSTLARAGRPARVRARGADRASRPADAAGVTCPSLPGRLSAAAVPLEVPS